MIEIYHPTAGPHLNAPVLDATLAVPRTARPGGDGHGRADDPIVAHDTLDSVVVGTDQTTMATKVRRVDVATYRSDRGEMLTEADMQGIFGDDITGLEGEDRDDVTLLMPFAGISFLWFIGVVRDGLGRFEDRFFSTVFLGSGLLFSR